jgi:hypothetical protein
MDFSPPKLPSRLYFYGSAERGIEDSPPLSMAKTYHGLHKNFKRFYTSMNKLPLDIF